MKTPSLTRRHFLGSAGMVIALPALESIGLRRFAPAVARPKHMVFIGFGWGVMEESW